MMTVNRWPQRDDLFLTIHTVECGFNLLKLKWNAQINSCTYLFQIARKQLKKSIILHSSRASNHQAKLIVDTVFVLAAIAYIYSRLVVAVVVAIPLVSFWMVWFMWYGLPYWYCFYGFTLLTCMVENPIKDILVASQGLSCPKCPSNKCRLKPVRTWSKCPLARSSWHRWSPSLT